jgi:hypothetical protein
MGQSNQKRRAEKTMVVNLSNNSIIVSLFDLAELVIGLSG